MRERKQSSPNLPQRKRKTVKTVMSRIFAVTLISTLCYQGIPNVYAINQSPKPTVEANEIQTESPVGTGEELQTQEPERIVEMKKFEPETKEQWEESISKAKLTGDCLREDVLKIAQTQLGYEQQEMDKQCYSRYGEWYGSPYQVDWGAMFVSFCLSYAKVPVKQFPQNDNAQKWIKELEKLGLFATTKDPAPEKGDLAFYQSKQGKKEVGIIADAREKSDHTYQIGVIGKTETGCVDKITYETTSKRLLGYGLLKKKQEEAALDAKTTKEKKVKKGESAVPSRSITLSSHSRSKYKTQTTYTSKEPDKAANIDKQIDWLGDGVLNPDANESSELSEKYRLYLDATGIKQTKPVDVLFVVDRSGSMGFDMDTGNEPPNDDPNKYKNTSRIRKVQDILLGSEGKEGLLDTVRNANAENNVALISFAGTEHGQWLYNWQIRDYVWQQGMAPNYRYTDDANVVLDWGQEKTVSLATGGATDYTAAYMLASSMFDKLDKDNGHDKIMIFLSDGVPTLYINNDGTQLGNGSTEIEPSTVEQTFIKRFTQNHSEVAVSTIGISSVGANDFDTTVLEYMASTAPNQTHGSFYLASDTAGLLNAFYGILNIANVSISDTLSQYVDLDGENANIQITATNTKKADDVSVLWKGTLDKSGAVIATNQGTGQVKAVTYDKATKQLKAEFADEYYLSEDYKVTLSFNVTLTEEAKEYLAGGNAYPDIGESNTDYDGNTTSSNKPGFNSNKEATLSYTLDGKVFNDKYPYPVVQASTLFIEKQSGKGVPIGGVEFMLYKADIVNGEWKKNGEAVAKKISGGNGNLSFGALQEGIYLLYETKAAAGYLLPDQPWHVTVNKEGTLELVDSMGNKPQKESTKYKIINYEMYVLPSSGGIGTEPFIILGAAMLTTAVALLYIERKRTYR